MNTTKPVINRTSRATSEPIAPDKVLTPSFLSFPDDKDVRLGESHILVHLSPRGDPLTPRGDPLTPRRNNEWYSATEGDSSEGEMFFHSSNAETYTTVVAEGNYVIKYSTEVTRLILINEDFYINSTSAAVLLTIVLLSTIIGTMSAFPYGTYSERITNVEWIFYCLIRAIVFAIVFTSQWCSLVVDHLYKHHHKSNSSGIPRHLLCILFAGLYSVLYSIKWMELDDILLWQATIPLFAMSWFAVFHNVINYRLVSSLNTANTNANMRMRSVILSCIKVAEGIVKASASSCDKVLNYYDKFCTIEVLVAKQRNSMFYTGSSKVDTLIMYEEDAYDRCKDTRISFVNLFIGFSLVPLSLSVLEDYGHSLYKLCITIPKNIPCTDLFDWLSFVLCSILSILYIVATYDIHHNNMRKLVLIFRSKQDMLDAIKHIVWQILPISAACIIGTTRFNASYSIFGRIAAKFSMPYSLGLPFIYTSLSLVFIIDVAASYKIICRSYKKFLSIFSLSLSPYRDMYPKAMRYCVSYYTLRYNQKRLKRFIRTCDDETLCVLYEELM